MTSSAAPATPQTIKEQTIKEDSALSDSALITSLDQTIPNDQNPLPYESKAFKPDRAAKKAVTKCINLPNGAKLFMAIVTVVGFAALMTFAGVHLFIAATIVAVANGLLTGLIEGYMNGKPLSSAIRQAIMSAAITFGLLVLFGGAVDKVHVVEFITSALKNTVHDVFMHSAANAPLVLAPLIGDGAAWGVDCLYRHRTKAKTIPNHGNGNKKISTYRNQEVTQTFQSISISDEAKERSEAIATELDLGTQKQYAQELIDCINSNGTVQSKLTKMKQDSMVLHIEQLWWNISKSAGVKPPVYKNGECISDGSGPEERAQLTHPVKRTFFKKSVNIWKLKAIVNKIGPDHPVNWHIADLYSALTYSFEKTQEGKNTWLLHFKYPSWLYGI